MALDDTDKQWIGELLQGQQTWFSQQLKEQEDRIVASVDQKLQIVEDRIVARINREVTDLAEVNRLALDRLENHEQRLTTLEHVHSH